MTSLIVDPRFGGVTVTVETRTGSGERTPQYGSPIERLVVLVDDVIDERTPSSDTTTSGGTVLYDTPDAVSLYALGSRVSVNGQSAVVRSVKRRVMGSPVLDHIEVALT